MGVESVVPGRRSARRPGRWLALGTVALALAVAPAGAARAAGNAEIRIGLMHFDYSERDPAGAFLDGEKGFVPAIVGEAELRGDLLFGRALGRFAKGTVSYDGHVQAVDPTTGLPDPTLDGLPIQTDSDASFAQAELQGGVLVGGAKQVALFGAVGLRRWNRDILNGTVVSRTGVPTTISGLSEVYTWWEVQAGARWTFLARPGTSWDVDARLVRTVSPEISVDLTPFVGVPTKTTLSLGATNGWRVGSTFRRDLNPHGLFISVNAYAEGYSFAASAVDPTFGIFEPDSSTVNLGLEVGVGGRF